MQRCSALFCVCADLECCGEECCGLHSVTAAQSPAAGNEDDELPAHAVGEEHHLRFDVVHVANRALRLGRGGRLPRRSGSARTAPGTTPRQLTGHNMCQRHCSKQRCLYHVFNTLPYQHRVIGVPSAQNGALADVPGSKGHAGPVPHALSRSAIHQRIMATS